MMECTHVHVVVPFSLPLSLDPSAPVDSLPFTPPYLRDESRQANSTPIVLADGRWFPDQAAFYRYYAKGCVGVLNPNFDE